MKREYAVLHDVENTSATVIYRENSDPVWLVFTMVVDVATGEKIAEALNAEQKALVAKENQ